MKILVALAIIALIIKFLGSLIIAKKLQKEETNG